MAATVVAAPVISKSENRVLDSEIQNVDVLNENSGDIPGISPEIVEDGKARAYSQYVSTEDEKTEKHVSFVDNGDIHKVNEGSGLDDALENDVISKRQSIITQRQSSIMDDNAQIQENGDTQVIDAVVIGASASEMTSKRHSRHKKEKRHSRKSGAENYANKEINKSVPVDHFPRYCMQRMSEPNPFSAEYTVSLHILFGIPYVIICHLLFIHLLYLVTYFNGWANFAFSY